MRDLAKHSVNDEGKPECPGKNPRCQIEIDKTHTEGGISKYPEKIPQSQIEIKKSYTEGGKPEYQGDNASESD